jgi:hypothetical protein
MYEKGGQVCGRKMVESTSLSLEKHTDGEILD